MAEGGSDNSKDIAEVEEKMMKMEVKEDKGLREPEQTVQCQKKPKGEPAGNYCVYFFYFCRS